MTKRSGFGSVVAGTLLSVLAAMLLSPEPALAAGLVRTGGEPRPPGEPARGGAAVAYRPDLYLPPGRQVRFPFMLRDGGRFVWDIQFNASLNDGTGTLSGYELDINDKILDSSEAPGTLSADGREVAVGPWRRGGLDLYRRVRVHKDRSLVRWLDIYTNPSAVPRTVRLRSYTAVRHGIGRTLTSQGGQLPGAKDCALIAVHAGGDRTAHVLLVTGDGRGRLPTKVDIKGNVVNARWTLTVPARGTAVLCHFKALGTEADLKRMMNRWQIEPLLKDLAPKVRRLIVNMNAFGGGVALQRSRKADSVLLADDRSLFGTIENKSFKLTDTPVGELELPAADTVGMAAGKDGRAFLVLADGQIVRGKVAAVKLQLRLGKGGVLTIPCEKVKQWSYRISKTRPGARRFPGPHVRLRSGERLTISPGDLALKFQTSHGTLKLDTQYLMEITMGKPGRTNHRAIFRNGSRLTGVVADKEFALTIKFPKSKAARTGKLTLSPSQVAGIYFTEEEASDITLTRAVLAGGDELFGTLTDARFKLITEFGALDAETSQIKTVHFKPGEPDGILIETWNGSALKCRLSKAEIAFEIAPSARLNIRTTQFVSIVRAQRSSPKTARARIERLLAQLGSESYKDREAAAKALVKMGSRIIPVLRKGLKNSDPEVRQRIEDALEKLKPKQAPPVRRRTTLDVWDGMIP